MIDNIAKEAYDYAESIQANQVEDARTAVQFLESLPAKIARSIHYPLQSETGDNGQVKNNYKLPYVHYIASSAPDVLASMMIYQRDVAYKLREPIRAHDGQDDKTSTSLDNYAFMLYDSRYKKYIIVTLDGEQWYVKDKDVPNLKNLENTAYDNKIRIHSPAYVRSNMMYDLFDKYEYTSICEQYALDETTVLDFIAPSVSVPPEVLQDMAKYQKKVALGGRPYDVRDINFLAYQIQDFIRCEVISVTLDGCIWRFRDDKTFKNIIRDSFVNKYPLDMLDSKNEGHEPKESAGARDSKENEDDAENKKFKKKNADTMRSKMEIPTLADERENKEKNNNKEEKSHKTEEKNHTPKNKKENEKKKSFFGNVFGFFGKDDSNDSTDDDEIPRISDVFDDKDKDKKGSQ